MNEKNIIDEFRKKTENCFHNIDGYTPADVEVIARAFVEDILEKECIDVNIIDVIITGSRCRGIEKEFSDLDIVLEFESETWREDSLFNILHEKEFSIGGTPVDFNPISKDDRSGCLEEYLPGVEKYLNEKEQLINDELLQKVRDLEYIGKPFIFGDVISLPIEYDDFLSVHEQQKLVRILKEQLKEQKPSIHEQINSAKLSNKKSEKSTKEKETLSR